MRAAFLVGRQTITSTLDRVRNAADPSRALDELVASSNGNRHLQVWHIGDTPAFAAPVSEKSRFGGPPAWLVRLIKIADALAISYKTAANNCTRIKATLGAAATADLIRIAILLPIATLPVPPLPKS